MKTQVLEAIGEVALNRSAQVDAALTANDRIKYYLSLLQSAIEQADHPERQHNSLRQERLACGIENAALDQLVSSARREGTAYCLSGVASVLEQLAENLRMMARPLPEFTERVEAVLATLPKPSADLLDRAAIDSLTRASDAQGFHPLVMDLHKALNALRASLAEERVDGAAVYVIDDSDRPIIAAFMAGVNRTAPLKFNHPGLGTTATRAGKRLIIQNDLGTTDAHVIVIHIEGNRVQFTHTDVHPERVAFLREMLKAYAVGWGEEESKEDESLAEGLPFYMVTGQFEASNSAELLDYLNFLGSRLVFLIDWNRARKQLRGFLRGKDRLALLSWAAEAEVGHRGFLEVGGAQLINRAIEDSAGSPIHFGDRLCDVLGHQAALEFLRFVFRAATEGLRNRQSAGLIQDRVRAELQAHFSSEGKRLFQLAAEQAAIIFEIASLVRDGVHAIEAGDHNGRYRKLALRAREYEHSADQLVVASREAIRRRPEYTAVFRVLETADSAADELEEIAFLMELLVSSGPSGDVLNALASFADMLVEASQEWVRALSYATRMDKPVAMSAQEDVRDFLTAVDALSALEHRADDAERALTYAAVEKASDFRQLHIYSKMAHGLEEASDALEWAGLIARDYLLGNTLPA